MEIVNLTKPSPLIRNTIQIETDKLWSGGEINLKFCDKDFGNEATIYTRLNGSEDIMKLFMAANLFDKVHVVLPYLPYARQDRACRTGEPFSLKVLANLFNSQKFKSVKVLDVHSSASEMLFKNLTNVSNYWFVDDVLHETKLDPKEICIVSPDAGALKKVKHLAEELGGLKTLPCFKHRSLENGGIESVYIPEDKLDPNLHYIIVDDICDGGRTFISLAEALKEKGARNIQVAVAHGIFSNGIIPLLNVGIQKVWTTTSIHATQVENSPVLFQFDVWKYLQ